jgi:hypothetical protein
MFLGLQDLDPDPLVRGPVPDPDPDPSLFEDSVPVGKLKEKIWIFFCHP